MLPVLDMLLVRFLFSSLIWYTIIPAWLYDKLFVSIKVQIVNKETDIFASQLEFTIALNFLKIVFC